MKSRGFAENRTAPPELYGRSGSAPPFLRTITISQPFQMCALDQIEEMLGEIKGSLNGNEGVSTRVTRLEERLNGTWKIVLIIGWLLNFLVAAGAVAAAITLK